MFDWLYDILGSMLAWFESWSGSYAVALLFYALIFKIVFLPFSIKQQKNQIKMAKLTPKIEVIKAKYKGSNTQASQQKMQQEIMELQQKEGYSPLSGCLPMLIQLPIVIFLYNVIRNPLSHIAKFSDEIIVKLQNAVATVSNGAIEAISIDNFGKIDQIKLISQINAANPEIFGDIEANLSALPNFNFFGINLAETPAFNLIGTINGWLVLIPILAAVSSWLSMFLMRRWNPNPAAAGADQQTQASMKIMDLVMPAMSLFIAFNFSGMLGIYWVYQSVISILQSFILSRVMPMPTYSEEELKAMKKAQKAAEKAQKEALRAQPKYRSLHYIDEDDYDELPEMKTKNNAPTKKSSGIDIPEIKD
ncbi:MAG: YidC/Oxa1 family membrane protein insertase [Clostridia bacterium]|nr:YidC/Oxa1 family membrane protein insertase [Clostridia bacterium]